MNVENVLNGILNTEEIFMNRNSSFERYKQYSDRTDFVVREDYKVEMIWRIEYEYKLFKWTLFVRGTYDEMRDYVESEIGYVGRHSACNEAEISAINKLHLPVYIAPKL